MVAFGGEHDQHLVTDLPNLHLFHCKTQSTTAKKLPREGEEDKEEEEEEGEDGDGQVVQEDALPGRRGQALRPDWQCGRGAG